MGNGISRLKQHLSIRRDPAVMVHFDPRNSIEDEVEIFRPVQSR